MKIAFVNDTSQHLGVQSIISVLKSGGHELKVFIDPQLFDDLYVYSKSLSRIFDCKKQIIDEIKAYKPDLIGFSVVTSYYQWACTMAKMIKEEVDVPIIFGGIHPTMIPERVIKNDFVDMVCVGEGEYPMLELSNSMQNGSIDYSIKNIWFKRNGKIIANEVRPLIEDLDSLPLPEDGLYHLTGSYFSKCYAIVTSRGCPYACSFCSHSHSKKIYQGKGRYLRQRSVQNVIQELIQAKHKYKVNTIGFCDDCFGFNLKWLKDFSNEYKNKISLQFICLMHPSHISSESLEYLKNAGCHSISLGIQSWDSNINKYLLNRKVSNDVMERAIRLILTAKIEVLLDNIFGYPGQEEEEYIKTLMVYSRIKPTRNYFYKLKYYPNTVLTFKARDKGWISIPRFEEVSDGRNLEGLRVDPTVNKENAKDKDSIKMQILFVVIDIVPKKITSYIIRKRIYRYFPTLISPAILTILRTLLTSDLETRVFRSSVILRYIYFIRVKISNIRLGKTSSKL